MYSSKRVTFADEKLAKLLRLLFVVLLVAAFVITVPSGVFATDGGDDPVTGGGVVEEQDPSVDPSTDPSTDPSGDEVLDGWVTAEDGKVFFYENGAAVTGQKNIDGANYYFGSDGAMVTGFARISGKLYYYNANGKRHEKAGWKTVSGKKYYCKGKGVFAVKPTKIAVKKTVKVKGKKKKVKVKTLYMFTKNGRLKTKKGLYKYNGKQYFGKGKGVLATGWTAFGKKGKERAAFFNKKTGAMVKNKKIGYLKVPKSGKLGRAYALGVKQLNKSGWTLKDAYKFSYKLTYYGRGWRQSSPEKYALRGFTEGRGNCYVMASTFYIMAKLLGYDVHQVRGAVAYVNPHSWTVIRHGKKEWVYDPNFTNETGRNGFKIYYGKSGTWRYTGYKKWK
ncbi:MAG: hypothetical protein E7220_02130 [Clostridiales bacterium]|nr:hypothetical protein [Clostridiales bacterium]